jgi:hypothetical protein
MPKKNRIDPIPDEFASYEEAGEFWDSHDTADYPDAFRTAKVVSRFRNRHYEIPISPDVIKALQAQARKKRVSLGSVANDLLRQRLKVAR